MSSGSGITVSAALVEAFGQAVAQHGDPRAARFLKVSIHNESLVPEGSTPMEHDLARDLELLQTDILGDDEPAYLLCRLDGDAGWMVINYVPDTAKVREKMLYASTRASLTKGLGDYKFVDSIFATNKSDVTPAAYSAHRRSMEAPQPLSVKEAEMERLRAEERAAGLEGYQGSRTRQSHVGDALGLPWGDGVEQALRELAQGQSSTLLVLRVDPATETLVVVSSSDATPSDLATSLPASEPSFSFLAWNALPAEPQRAVVFTYCCPPSSPVKHRMVYSSSVLPFLNRLKTSLGLQVTKKIETDNPTELDEHFLMTELGVAESSPRQNPGGSAADDKKPFARPKGPGRKR